MSQKFLDRAQVGATLEQVGREGVAQDVRMDPARAGGRRDPAVEDPAHRAKVLHALRAMFQDTVKGRWLQPDGTYRRRPAEAGEPAFRVQQALQRESARIASRARDAVGMTFEPEQRNVVH